VAQGILGFLSNPPLGHYRIAVPTGLTTGLTANAPIFAARWNSTTIRALITRLEVQAVLVTPFTAAQEITVAAYYARSWTAADTGGTSVTLTTPFNQQNSIADVAPIVTMNVATTAAITAGTRTLDGNALLWTSAAQTLAAASAGPLFTYDIFELNSADSQFPLNIQGANALWQGIGTATGPEGIVVTCPVAQSAGGTVRYVIEMEWLEYNITAAVGAM
jgi:hypothetical protein